jgi:hypothetical protein
MDAVPPHPDDSRERDIADASDLLRDPDPPVSGIGPPRAAPPAAPTSGEIESFEVLPGAAPTSPAPQDFASGSPRAKKMEEKGPSLEPSKAVEQVWSRGAEWGPTLALLAVVALGVFVLLYATISVEWYGVAFLVLLSGGLALAVLSYPILITLERPVRVTPEQAVTDYFTALSHHVPHYRRMWLLLSNAGRVSGAFASFEGFTAYWKARLVELKGGQASSLTPLKFQVVDFRSEKSAGRTEISASYTVRVSVRGRTAEGPIHEIRVTATLVKGPDRMWYLDRGTLP